MKLTSIMKKAAIKESLLLEDGMDRAQLILAAKAVIDELQQMAEKVAKMEAEGIMPLLDGIRTAFGPEFAERLSGDAAEALRHAMDAIKASKEKIGANITNMEQIVTGEGPGNDMATGAGLDMEPEMDAEPAPEMTAEPEMGAEVEPEEHSEEDLEDLFGDDAPVGRETKESAVAKNINMLRESTDPDRLVMASVMTLIKGGMPGQQAVMETATRFAIDASDVVDVIREQTKK